MAPELPIIVDVAVPYRVGGSFHYTAQPDVLGSLSVGSLIEVPFQQRTTHGFVLGFPEKPAVEITKLKAIGRLLAPYPVFDETMLRFLRWVSEYYFHPLGEVLAAAIPRASWNVTKKTKATDISNHLIEGLAFPSEKPELNSDQRSAVEKILDPADPRPVLLHGITGSGKTEVYMGVMKKILDEGKSAIVLVPEIALTPLLLGRFSSRFPGQTAVLHSDLSPKERYGQWELVRQGAARVVIGARSAIFAPVKNLGLIVIDEEHEGSFKQEDSLRYHARDIAIVRGQMEHAKVVLGSATPSVESYTNARSGKFLKLELPKRIHDRKLPSTLFVDLKEKENLYCRETPWLGRLLIAKVDRVLKSKQQVLLYLNRLGYAHFLFCEDCGHTYRCRNCDVALTYYSTPPLLKCHYCGVIKYPPQECENCSGTSLVPIGFGTEQVERVFQKIFPQARIRRMDRSVIKNRKDLESLLRQIAEREVDIVIGTQMIAKGHDFPGIALVGILMADASLNLPDFRAFERTFQAITQVSGRAGRAEDRGEVVIQTLNPLHPVIVAAAENRSAEFYQMELEARRRMGYPPFIRMAVIRFQHRNPVTVEKWALEAAAALKPKVVEVGGSLLGPAEAPLSKLKKLHRWQCVVKCASVRNMKIILKFAEEYHQEKRPSVPMAIDVDPISLM